MSMSPKEAKEFVCGKLGPEWSVHATFEEEHKYCRSFKTSTSTMKHRLWVYNSTLDKSCSGNSEVSFEAAIITLFMEVVGKHPGIIRMDSIAGLLATTGN